MFTEQDLSLTSGTASISDVQLSKENTLIVIERVGMFYEVIFDAAPSDDIELEAWDTLSDEALVNFEAMLD